MYKGYKRKVIVVRDTDSSLFESAYFLLRDGGEDFSVKDMVKEASRIIRDKSEEEKCPVSVKKFFTFSVGCAITSVIFTLVVIFLA